MKWTIPLAPFYWLERPANGLDEVFCVSFFRGLAPSEVLRRFGPSNGPGREMSLDELWDAVTEFTMTTGGEDGGGHVGVVQAGGWSVAIELLGWYATHDEYYTVLSQGCEMVAVLRHDYSDHRFVYAVDGGLVTGFSADPPSRLYGSVPAELGRAMRKLDLPITDAGWKRSGERLYEHKNARAFALAAEVTGVSFTRDLLDSPLLVGPIDQR